MQISEIPQYLKITQTELAARLGKTKANFHQYISGRRGAGKSEVLQSLLKETGLMSEETIFPDVTGHKDGRNEAKPAYWLNLAHEAVDQAAKRGLGKQYADALKNDIVFSAKRDLEGLF